MAEDLVLKALGGDEDAASSECGDEKSPTTFDEIGQEAMSHTETDGMPDAGDGHSSPHNTKSGKKRKRPENVNRKTEFCIQGSTTDRRVVSMHTCWW